MMRLKEVIENNLKNKIEDINLGDILLMNKGEYDGENLIAIVYKIENNKVKIMKYRQSILEPSKLMDRYYSFYDIYPREDIRLDIEDLNIEEVICKININIFDESIFDLSYYTLSLLSCYLYSTVYTYNKHKGSVEREILRVYTRISNLFIELYKNNFKEWVPTGARVFDKVIEDNVFRKNEEDEKFIKSKIKIINEKYKKESEPYVEMSEIKFGDVFLTKNNTLMIYVGASDENDDIECKIGEMYDEESYLVLMYGNVVNTIKFLKNSIVIRLFNIFDNNFDSNYTYLNDLVYSFGESRLREHYDIKIISGLFWKRIYLVLYRIYRLYVYLTFKNDYKVKTKRMQIEKDISISYKEMAEIALKDEENFMDNSEASFEEKISSVENSRIEIVKILKTIREYKETEELLGITDNLEDGSTSLYKEPIFWKTEEGSQFNQNGNDTQENVILDRLKALEEKQEQIMTILGELIEQLGNK